MSAVRPAPLSGASVVLLAVAIPLFVGLARPGSPLHAETPANPPPHWIFVGGRTHVYDLGRTVVGKTALGPARMVLKITIRETVTAIPDAGPCTLQCTVDALSLELEQGGRRTSYDSKKKSKIPADDLLLQCRANLVGKGFEMQVQTTGEITATTGLELAMGNEGAGPEGQAVAAEIKSLLAWQFRCVPLTLDGTMDTWQGMFDFPLGIVFAGQLDVPESVTFVLGAKASEKSWPGRSITSKSEFQISDVMAYLTPAGGPNGGAGAAGGGAGGASGLTTGGDKPPPTRAPKVNNTGSGKYSFADAGFLVQSQRKTSLDASLDKSAISWSVEYTAELKNKPDQAEGTERKK
ncbi:MAG: hypothetical protein HYY93_00865 [Planctomycetes bacterium]|nr:hypothetical protein [Planctomycetota bacterium]